MAIGALAFTSLSLDGWYIDDAGISLAYARNLARDGLLVAQSGDEPVEGYSNPLWIAINTLVCLIYGGASLVQTRIVGVAVLLLCYCRLFLAFAKNGKELFKWSLLYAFAMLQPSIVVYSLSGLENSLMVLFSVELLIQATMGAGRSLFMVSLAASGLVLTRPDAAIYAIYIPLVICFEGGSKWQRVKAIIKALLMPAIAMLAYLSFRLAYFGRVYPNTYYAKALPIGESLRRIVTFDYDIQRNLLDATVSAFGQAGAWLLLLGGAWVVLGGIGSLSIKRTMLPMLILTVLGAFSFAYLPTDWMPMFRFATIYFIGLYAIAVHVICERIDPSKGIGLALILLTSCATGCYNGVRKFVTDSPISVDHVSERGRYFSEWGLLVGICKPTLLTADAGGILLDESVRLVDLGMLCDARIADALGALNKEPNRKAFYDYIFDEVCPTFIATRAYHSYLAWLDKDERFRRDYVPIHEYIDIWTLSRYNVVVMSGDYVRKDVVMLHQEALEKMRQQSSTIYYPFDNNHIQPKQSIE